MNRVLQMLRDQEPKWYPHSIAEEEAAQRKQDLIDELFQVTGGTPVQVFIPAEKMAEFGWRPKSPSVQLSATRYDDPDMDDFIWVNSDEADAPLAEDMGWVKLLEWLLEDVPERDLEDVVRARHAP